MISKIDQSIEKVKMDASNTAADVSAISEALCVIYLRICIALQAEDNLGRIMNNFTKEMENMGGGIEIMRRRIVNTWSRITNIGFGIAMPIARCPSSCRYRIVPA